MAITQISISESDLGLALSTIVLKNSYPNQSTPVNDISRGQTGVVNADYTGDASANLLTVGVPRFKRIKGASNAFVNFAGKEAVTMQNNTLALNLDRQYLQIVEIPAAQEGKIAYSIVQNAAFQIANDLTLSMDTDTILEMYNKSLEFGATLDTPFSNVIKANGTSLADAEASAMLNTAFEKMSNLPEEAFDYDVSTPLNGRVIVAKQKFITNLRKSGIAIVGSEFAYKTFVSGVESYGVPYGLQSEDVINRNYMGSYNGFTTFLAIDLLFPTPYAGEVLAVATHPMATTRATTPPITKYLDTLGVVGKQYQYQVFYGILCARPWMVNVLVTSDFEPEEVPSA